MAVPVLRTWTPGDLATPALLNSAIRDLVNFERGPVSSGKPMGVFTHSATQSVTNNTWLTPVLWNTNIRAPAEGTAFHSTVSNTGNVTIQTAGLYDVRVQIHWAAHATGRRAVRIMKNGSSIVHHGINSSCSTPDGASWTGNTMDTGMECSMLTVLAVADVLTVNAWQNSGGALNIQNDPGTYFAVRWIASS